MRKTKKALSRAFIRKHLTGPAAPAKDFKCCSETCKHSTGGKRRR